jgi:hypothetical protein
MRRLVKEELLAFEGKQLFPERFAYTLKYELSDKEMELYNKATDYVRTSFDMALKVLDPKRANAVGFAPYPDYSVPTQEEYSILQSLIKTAVWWGQDDEILARNYAILGYPGRNNVRSGSSGESKCPS